MTTDMPPEPRASETRVLRPAQPPADQLDFDDRHDTRATESDELMHRYAALHRDRRKDDWHRLAMGLVVFVAGVVVYLTAFVVLSRLLPNLSPQRVIQVVGIAFAAAGGGVAARAAGQALASRLRSRGRGSKSL